MGFDDEPRTLQFGLADVNCYFVLPTMKNDYAKENPPHVYVAMRARYNKMFGKFIAGRISLDGTWLSPPQIRESILVAGYYSEKSEVVDLPEKLVSKLEEAARTLEPMFGPAFEYNRSLLVNTA